MRSSPTPDPLSHNSIGRSFLDAALETFLYSKKNGDGVLRQLSGGEMSRVVGPDFNSIAVIVKHMRGNMLSRWTDFLTTDGEKPSRERDEEFREDEGISREEILACWEEGWTCTLGAIRALTPADLEKTVRIRGQELSVPRAILRQIEHYGYHVGQMVLIGKTIKGDAWQTLTVPRGATATVNRSLGYDPNA
jgi:hypothetical protein